VIVSDLLTDYCRQVETHFAQLNRVYLKILLAQDHKLAGVHCQKCGDSDSSIVQCSAVIKALFEVRPRVVVTLAEVQCSVAALRQFSTSVVDTFVSVHEMDTMRAKSEARRTTRCRHSQSRKLSANFCSRITTTLT